MGKGKRKKGPSYVKSNSLGLLAVADAHDYFGSAAMNWEGGEEGERKIQDVKPTMGIRRKNTAWQSLCMQKIYTQDSIDWLLKRLPTTNTKSPNTNQDQYLHNVYRDYNEAQKIVQGDVAMSLYEMEGRYYILYKPTGEDYISRSSTALLEVVLEDKNGFYRFGCWFAEISIPLTNEKRKVVPRKDLEACITRNILALPLVTMAFDKPEITTCQPKFYLITDDWDERINGGNFIKSHITESLFTSWYE